MAARRTTAATGGVAGVAVIDLDAARAQRLEAGSVPFTVTFKSETFTFPPVQEWEYAAIAAMSTGDAESSLHLLIGEKDARRFMSLRPTMGDIEALFSGLSKASGIGDAGNSLRSLTP